MTIHEPMTFATDLAWCGWSAFLGMKLFRLALETGSRAMRLWSGAFAATAAAALVGGITHGVGPEAGPVAATLLWKATVLLAGTVSFFLVASAAAATFSPKAANFWIAAAALKLAAYSAWMLGHDAFQYVIYDYGSAMLIVVALQLVRRSRGPAPGAWWIVAGIAGSLLAAGVQYSGIAPHRHFNHNDLYHVLQMAAAWLLYRGGRELR
jgi:hypothetical protein